MAERPAVVIPAFNESVNLSKLLPEVKKFVENIIVVDDGSTDNTYEVANKHNLIILKNEKNEGKGWSLIRGVREAGKKGFCPVILMDADGQHPPELIKSFIKKYNEEEADIVIGNRVNRKSMPFIRFIVNALMSKIQSILLGLKLHDTQCGFRLYGIRAIELHREVNFEFSRFEYESEILLYAKLRNFKIVEINIPCIYLPDRKSKVSPIRDTIRWFIFLLKINKLKKKLLLEN